MSPDPHLVQPNLTALESFILKAKSVSGRVSDANMAENQLGALECVYSEGPYTFHGSYYGKVDQIGQELIFFKDSPIWGANHYAKLIDKQAFSLEKAEEVVAVSRSACYYQEHRFLGRWHYEVDGYSYEDDNSGDVRFFQGMQTISDGEKLLYLIYYHGGLIETALVES